MVDAFVDQPRESSGELLWHVIVSPLLGLTAVSHRRNVRRVLGERAHVDAHVGEQRQIPQDLV